MVRTYKRRNLGKRKKRRRTRKQRGGVSFKDMINYRPKWYKKRQERKAAERADRMAGLQSGDISPQDREKNLFNRLRSSASTKMNKMIPQMVKDVLTKINTALMVKVNKLKRIATRQEEDLKTDANALQARVKHRIENEKLPTIYKEGEEDEYSYDGGRRRRRRKSRRKKRKKRKKSRRRRRRR